MQWLSFIELNATAELIGGHGGSGDFVKGGIRNWLSLQIHQGRVGAGSHVGGFRGGDVILAGVFN